MANGVIVGKNPVVYSQEVNNLNINAAWGSMYMSTVNIALPFNAQGRHISVSFVPVGSYTALCMIDTVAMNSISVDLVRPNSAIVSGTIYVEIK